MKVYRRKRHILTGIVLFILAAAAAEGETEKTGNIVGEIRSTIDAVENLENGKLGFAAWSGMNLETGYSGYSPFRNVDTVFWFTFGLDIDSAGYYRLPDNSIYSGSDPAVDPETDPFYIFLRPQVSLGLSQGILPGGSPGRDLLQWYAFARFFDDQYFYKSADSSESLILQSGLPERNGTALLYFISGFNLSTLERNNSSRTLKGFTADICVSGTPAAISGVVAEDGYAYAGVHADVRGFITYVEIVSDKGLNLFSLYQGWWFRADYVFGPHIPLQVLQNASGRMWEEGLGGAVRGVETNRFPAPLKIIASTDLRCNFPSIGVRSLLPGAVLFFDAGYYRYFEEQINGGEAGILLSTGGGVFIDVFGMFELVIQATYLINGTLIDGTRFVPFDFEFNLHF